MTDDAWKSAHEERRNREFSTHLRMWVGVCIVMAAIIGVWALLLPTQLRRIAARSESETARWTTLTSDVPTVGLREGLQQMRDQFDALDQAQATPAVEEAAAPRAQLPVLEERSGAEKQIDLLRARLESGSANE